MKNKNFRLFLSFLLVFFCLILRVEAADKYLILTDSVNIRKGPSTSYGKYVTSKLGSKYYLLNNELIRDEAQDGSCDNGWYEINYNGSKAYVCSEYVKVYDQTNTDTGKPSTSCEAELSQKGFSSGYYKSLCELKSKYPEWNFEAINTGLDFNSVVMQESKCGKSYIETNDPYYQDTSCSSAYSSTSIWKPASVGAVKYYLDPRNFLDEKNIFAFETLSYNSSLESGYLAGVPLVLKNASFYQYHLAIGNDLSSIMNKVGKDMNVSPVFIASRIYQELGSTNSLYDLYSGVYSGYKGYYNFYNIGVTDSCATSKSRAVCGLETAKSRGWYGLEAAIKGGVTSISNNYINKNQNTRYLQKFNVNPSDPNKLYLNQYMTNIRAPYGEAATTFNSYKNSESLNHSFTFSIPVYENMPALTMLPTSNDDNISNGAVGGSASDAVGDSNMAPNTIVTSSGLRLSGDIISGIELSTSVNDLINKIESVGGKGSVSIKNSQGNVVSSGNIGTNYSILINGATTKEYKVVIYGDASGDGNINALDLLMVQRHILKTESLSGAYSSAGDVNKDGKVNALDLLIVQRHILKTESIKQ